MLHLRRNKLILAFPGMGKTPLSIRNGKYRDIDFGTFRSGMDVSKEDESTLLLPFANYLMAMDSDVNGLTFMTNEPKLMQLIHVDKVYLPSNYQASQYCATKMGVTVRQIIEWKSDWYNMAQKYNVPVVFVDNGLDKYLTRSVAAN